MSWTKRQIVTAAYEELGLASYVFDLEPEQLQSACRRMDSMFAGWEAKGIHLGYTSSDNPDTSSLDAVSGIPSYANSAAYLNLAVLTAPSMGKNISPITASAAKASFLSMLSRTMGAPVEYTISPTMPMGAGQKRLARPYAAEVEQTIETGPDGQVDFFN